MMLIENSGVAVLIVGGNVNEISLKTNFVKKRRLNIFITFLEKRKVILAIVVT